MLGEREVQLTRLLMQQTQPMTARAIAAELGVSVRSVKTYVQRICHEHPGAIASDRHGYRIDRAAASDLIRTDAPNDVPQTTDERVAFVLRRLLASSEPLNIFDLCEQLYVSYSTAKSVATAVRKRISPFHLGLKQESNHLSITGRERDRRRLLSDLLYSETAVSFLDLKAIQRAFPQIDIPYIEACVRAVLSANRCFANDYSMINLVLHIAISVDRIISGLAKKPAAASDGASAGGLATAGIGEQESSMAHTIARELERHFDIILDAGEVAELAILLASRTTMLDYRAASREGIEKFVGSECIAVVDEMIRDLKENAGIDLSEHEFYARFALHIKNLIVRAQTGGLTKNPLTQQIKTACPLLYDTAVIEVDLLQRRCRINVNDDEIAYIAFHLGSSLETQKRLTSRVKAVLYCPSYYNIDAKILLFLNRHFEDDLIVTNVITDEADLKHLCGVELLIATVPVNSYFNAPVHLINIVPTDADRHCIRKLVDGIRGNKRRMALRRHLEALIEPDLFETGAAVCDREGIIHHMALNLLEHGYVTEDFERQVHEREALSSTVFGSVAVPHALRQASLKSTISILTSSSPITWGDCKVNLVVMLSFSKSDQEVFYEVFDPLVSILANREQANALARTSDYETFIAKLCDMMG